MDLQEKSPEMNELGPGLKSLKIWAHNFEKQKSWSTFTKPRENARVCHQGCLFSTLNFILGLICETDYEKSQDFVLIVLKTLLGVGFLYRVCVIFIIFVAREK